MVVLEQIISIIHTFTYTKATIINRSFIHGDFGYTRIAKHRFAKKNCMLLFYLVILIAVMALC